MKLMISTEVPRDKREEAARRAARTMNSFQKVSSAAAKIESDELQPPEMVVLADLYRDCQIELGAMFSYVAGGVPPAAITVAASPSRKPPPPSSSPHQVPHARGPRPVLGLC